MRKFVTASALGLVMAAPLAAHAEGGTAAELEALKQQLQVLMQRVEELEARQAADAEKATRVESRVAEAEATNDNQTDQLAKTGAKVASADWATRIRAKGDVRYRHESIDLEGSKLRDRQRLRVRFGLDARINDTLNAGFQLATGDDLDPRSTNVTLGDANLRDSLRLDLAYVDWKAFDGAVVTLGKQKQPWVRAGNSLFHDADVNPEGASFKYGAGEGPFASAWGFWLSEASGGADANLFGAQLGYRWGGLTAFVMYNDFGAVQNSTLNFAEFPAGNTTYKADSSCNLPAPAANPTSCYRYDYDILELGLQYDFTLGQMPAMVFGNYAENGDPDDLTTAYSLGFLLGRAEPGRFEFGILHQEIERDALFGGMVDSDFAGGSTQGSGQQFRFGYGLAKGWTFNAQYFLNKRNYDDQGGTERNYDRYQLDLNFRF